MPSGADRRSLRIAVIDDERIMVDAITRLFPAHDVAAFSRAATVLSLVQAGERFDVIISDLMMPGLTGAELHAGLLAASPDQAARIVFVTAGATTDATRVFVSRCPVPLLVKPFDPSALKDLVEGWIDPDDLDDD